MKFRKKPVVIDAVQYIEYGKLVKGMCNSISCYNDGNIHPHVHTIHNNQIVNLEVGDWIIPEPDGRHYYPCKPDIFEKTYEVAESKPTIDPVEQEQKKIIAYMVIKLFPYCGHHLGKILHQHTKYPFYAMWPEYFEPIYGVEQEPEVSQEERMWTDFDMGYAYEIGWLAGRNEHTQHMPSVSAVKWMNQYENSHERKAVELSITRKTNPQ